MNAGILCCEPWNICFIYLVLHWGKNVGKCVLEIVSSNKQLCLFIKEWTFAKAEKSAVQLPGCWVRLLCGMEACSDTLALSGFKPFNSLWFASVRNFQYSLNENAHRIMESCFTPCYICVSTSLRWDEDSTGYIIGARGYVKSLIQM